MPQRARYVSPVAMTWYLIPLSYTCDCFDFSLPQTELIMKSPFVTVVSSVCMECNSQAANCLCQNTTVVCSADCNQASCVGEKPTERWCPGGKV